MSNTPLPVSPACERNKDPILDRLRFLFAKTDRVLEIGSGTGQHAVHFAAHMPWLEWTCSDRAEYRDVLRARCDSVQLDNLHGPLELDVMQDWPAIEVDAVFSANTAHIMAWSAVELMFEGVGRLLAGGGLFVLYGPFHYGGEPTSAGNAAFDRELVARGNGEGIRDVAMIQQLAAQHRMNLIADLAMPANNRLLAMERSA
ncbi:MAG: DUF938 domain-containing protein [Proteobacteria bacterium]|nr:DUF938 domain-containing protein [Pseudomonadota bacterium]